MIAVRLGKASFAIDVPAIDLTDGTVSVSDLTATLRCRRDGGGMWVPTREPLGRVYAVALMSMAHQLACGRTVDLGYGIEAVAQ